MRRLAMAVEQGEEADLLHEVSQKKPAGRHAAVVGSKPWMAVAVGYNML